MSFRKIVQLSCIKKALLWANMFTILTSIVFWGVSEAQGGQTYSFKGIDPPFPPPKYEFLMSPKRTLVFMEVDQATGTKFSLVRVIGGLPGGTPCVGGVNWPRGYEIVGEVPADIDLADDTIAKSLVERGKSALFNFCPEASTTELLNVWLFKDGVPTYRSDNYEVYASWEKQFPRAPGPEIETEYHNKVLEHAKRLAESRIRKVTPTRQSSTLPDPFPATSAKTVTSERDIGKDIVGLIIGIVLVVIMLILLCFFSVLAFYICLIIGPIASIVILYVAYTTSTPLTDNDKAILIGTALAWIGFIIYLQINRNKSEQTISSSSGGGYSSYNYSEPDSEPEREPIFRIFKTTCPVCNGDGKCQNDFHSENLIDVVMWGIPQGLLGVVCPACGGIIDDRRKCSTCGGSGEVY